MSEIKQWWIHCAGKQVLDFEAADTDYVRNPLNGYTLVMTRHDHDRLMKHAECELAKYKRAEITHAIKAAHDYREALDEIARLKQRLADAEKALEFYADSKSWKFVDYQSEVRETILPTDLILEGMQFPFGGKRAREYFKKWKNKRTSAESEK